MNTIVLIGLLGVFAYHCTAIHKDFRGSSVVVEITIGFAGVIGYAIYYIALIWSFWHFPWWQPLVGFASATLVGGFSAFFFQRNIVGMMMSLVLVIVFSILSIIKLI